MLKLGVSYGVHPLIQQLVKIMLYSKTLIQLSLLGANKTVKEYRHNLIAHWLWYITKRLFPMAFKG